MQSVTKNRQSPETLRSLAFAAFPTKQVASVDELTEGMFNAAYRVDFTDGSASILKIAAADTSGLLSNEVNLMRAEVSAMEMLRAHGFPFVPEVQFSDFTRTLCSGTYFFMEVMPGRSLQSCRAELPDETVSAIMSEVGAFQRRLAEFHSDRFGLLGDERRFDTLYELEHYMFGNVLRDAATGGVELGFEPDALLAMLERDRACFDEVAVPSLVHLDMWAGNVFVLDGRVTGVIDWERALWGDPFMDDCFRTQTRHPAFAESFGLRTLTEAQQRRILWYDVFLYVTMLVECRYRQYENAEPMAAWFRRLLDNAWRELNSERV